MTPLEINKKIQDLKKIPYDTHSTNCKEIPCFNWAENIEDAFELFEEMQVSILTIDRYNGTYSQGKWLCTYETLCPEEVLMRGPQSSDSDAVEFWNDPHWVVAATTAPMAICLAYIAWREKNE